MRLTTFDRTCTAAETFDRVAPLLAAFGITRIARHTGLDRIGIPVWCAYMPNARSIVVAQGKGATDADARTSAVMEALERAVACDPAVAVLTASLAALKARGQAFHPLSGLVASGHEPLAPDDETDWVEGQDLLTGEPVLVPLQAVTLDRTIRHGRFWQSSDGLASGNTLDEAIFHGLMERVERDAHALWLLRPLAARLATCVSPSDFDCPVIRALEGQIAAAGLKLRLFDATSDLGIPCFSAYLGPEASRLAGALKHVDVTFGAGTHPVPRQAVLRAITESAQSRLTYISGARDDVFPEDYDRPLADSTRQAMLAEPRAWTPSTLPASSGAALVGALHARGAGLMIAVRLSRPDLPFAVAKVLAPALENPEGKRRQRYGTRALRQALTQ
ncbi:ribosomal protein S12 methylthiotransferase accessory factor [Rhizobium sp. PP-F2F-G48]|uniref:YcaO-like family protein n=1 Tax=Rhizobium sp. PP-F2F-G48 TaxID=2135651 RepID=UPI0010438FFC|nr:YcaO-like family protein [Rhizobium sp. PP-F2F-G48]TCM54234.1 ribosomal protein S12 methylthiotransferase accessory factor [Rhizobium sp. PP-F2F-G48]